MWASIWKKTGNAIGFITDPDIKVQATYKEYYERLEKRLKYLQKVLQEL